jgi:rhodanese-related sulfurtransferase
VIDIAACVVLAFLGLGLAEAEAEGGAVSPEPETYRLEEYRAPTPATLHGAKVPGSIWLPDTGYGELAPIMLDYFSNGLKKATRDDRTQWLVFYCLADCWMSWNAAKRALWLGYANVAWYREGTDGWSAAGLPLQPASPEPRP